MNANSVRKVLIKIFYQVHKKPVVDPILKKIEKQNKKQKKRIKLTYMDIHV